MNNTTTPTTADGIDTYEGMQAQRNEYAKMARIAERNGEQEKADRARAEVKFLNKRLREIHRNKFYKAKKGTVTGSRR